ncbi:MAG: threonine-phosphate decarboxylase [Syntrophomonadaceae bacterium]|nr:threonine-phosphate decarboxylase [Syntrophomonadaceae bacterium]
MGFCSLRTEHGGNIWKIAEKWGLTTDGMIDFSASINPLGMSSKAVEAINSSIHLLVHYPEPYADSLKETLSQYLGVDSHHLVLGNGGSELIYLIGRMFYKNRVLLLAPTFSEYGRGIDNPSICRINLSPDNGFELPLEELLDEIKNQDLVFIDNPNNPTGKLFAKDDLLQVVEKAGSINATVVVDEAFIDFLGNSEVSLRDRIKEYRNLLVLGSLTKFFALPGLRLGYAAGHHEIIGKMEQMLPAWRINTLAIAAAKAALTDYEYIRETIEKVKTERDFILRGLADIPGLKVYPGASNFLLIDAQGLVKTAEEIQEHLRPQGIIIRQCSNFLNLSPFYLRIALRGREDNRLLLNALKGLLQG